MLSLSVSFYLCVALQLVYPIYASFKALSSRGTDDDTQWLTYWVVYACLTTIEAAGTLVINWIPLYYEIKLLAVVWLIAPQTMGAKQVYDKFLQPLLEQYASKIDPVFSKTEQALHSKYTGQFASLLDQYGPQVAEQAIKFAQEQAKTLQEKRG
mmetsp:Transcript_20946/g.45824  ORF Transcript_20946/g.45824 Transcript_20946/m.45824 type:complete len:154 (-) Transcript_20946:796-1257(-)